MLKYNKEKKRLCYVDFTLVISFKTKFPLAPPEAISLKNPARKNQQV